MKSSFLDAVKNIFKYKPREPEFGETHFKNYNDFYGHFSIFYPKDWKCDPPVVIDEGGYAVVFHSKRSNSQIRIGVETILPLKFNFKKYAKNEIESSSSGMLSKAHPSKFMGYPCFTATYQYENEGRTFAGKRFIFYTGDRIFSIFYTYPAEEKNLEKTFSYICDSLIILPTRTKIFKCPTR